MRLSGLFRPFLLIAVVLLVGCSSALTKENAKKLEISQTTDSEVIDLFGWPKTTETITGTAGNSKLYTYVETYFVNVGPMMWMNYHVMFVEVRNEKVNAYLFASSDNDATQLDSSLGDRITVGQTTLDDLIVLLGPPHGAARANTRMADFKEVATGKEDGMLAWVDARPISGVFKLGDLQMTMLIVHLDANRRVVDKTLKTMRYSS